MGRAKGDTIASDTGTAFNAVFGTRRSSQQRAVVIPRTNGEIDWDCLYQSRALEPVLMPGDIEAFGDDWYGKRDGFHCTVFDPSRLHPLVTDQLGVSAEKAYELLNSVAPWASDAPLRFRETDHWRMVIRDERRTLIQMLRVEGLSELYGRINRALGTRLPTPPAHVTVFTGRDGKGIGIALPEELDDLSRELDAGEVAILKGLFGDAPLFEQA